MLGKSINEMRSEDYLFEDYHWKSGISIWVLDLLTSACYIVVDD